MPKYALSGFMRHQHNFGKAFKNAPVLMGQDAVILDHRQARRTGVKLPKIPQSEAKRMANFTSSAGMLNAMRDLIKD